MIKVHAYSTSGTAKWDPAILELSRVPCLHEFVRVHPDYPAVVVRQVIHNLNAADETVAGIVLDDCPCH